MSENTTPAGNEKPVSITEITREGSLPDSRYIPMKCSRASREMLTYNRHEISPPMTMFRLRTRDCVVMGNREITLSISVLDYGFCGAVCITLVNHAENRERSQTKLYPFTLGSVGLPVSSQTDDLMYRSEGVSVDVLRAPGKWHVRAYFERFDDVRSLYVNTVVEDMGSETAFSAVPVGKKDKKFLLRHGVYAMPASGKIVIGADVYELSSDSSIGWLERERSNYGKIGEHSRLSISGFCGDVRFGLCASDSGVFTTENALVFDGKTYRPEEMTIRRDDSIWYVSTPDEHIQLYLPIIAERTECIKLGPLRSERRREYGQCFGELVMFGERYTVSSAVGCGEHIIGKS
ncbi:MAG: DUF2804 family protein [Ruminococcaceae bacterium]|nr:DUF2804 family protein [Oscillospiraceae bacterium]